MTDQEFQTWCQYLSHVFPDTGEWLRRLDGEVRRRWHDMAFAHIELDDARAAVDAMFTGKLDKPAAYNREDLPRVVSRFANQRRYEREEAKRYRDAEPEPVVQPLDPSEPTMAEMYREKIRARLDDPTCPEDVKRRLREGMSTWSQVLARWDARLELRQDSYRCWTCRDSGSVAIVSAKTLKQAVRFISGRCELSDIVLTTVICCCSCRAGDGAVEREIERVKRSKNPKDKRLPENYQPLRADDWRSVPVAISDHDTIKLAIAWAQEYQKRRTVERDEKEAPYQAFAEWNEG